MTDFPKDDAETPIQRALRLKKAALETKPKLPGSGKIQRKQNAAMTAGSSKPWMSR